MADVGAPSTMSTDRADWNSIEKSGVIPSTGVALDSLLAASTIAPSIIEDGEQIGPSSPPPEDVWEGRRRINPA